MLSPPSGWNKFEGEPGAYDVKWQDLVSPAENIKVSSTPVGSDIDSVLKLGGGIPVNELGEKLAKKRGAELVSANLVNSHALYCNPDAFNSSNA